MRHSQSEYSRLRLDTFDASDGVYFYANRFSAHVRRFRQHVLSPHEHEFFVLVYFTGGKGWHEIDFDKYEIAPGALFFLRPGQLHHWEFESGTEGFVVLFSEKYLAHYLRNFPFGRHPFFSNSARLNYFFVGQEERQEFAVSFEKMYRSYLVNDVFSLFESSAVLTVLLVRLARESATEVAVSLRSRKQFDRFMQQLDQHFFRTHEVKDYAAELAISTRQLARITKDVSGTSPGQLIQAKLLLEAQRLLATGDQPVAEISDQLGFGDQTWFSKWFRKQTGKTPLQFRKNYQ